MKRIVLLALAFSAAARADEVASLLKKPVSPASIALLAPYSKDPRVVERWKSALADPNPDVRGVAARAVTTCGATELLPDVETALGKESELNAAREQARALILLSEGSADSIVMAAASRFAGLLDGDISLALARARGPAALPLYFSRLRGLQLTDADRAAFFQIASRGGKETLAAAAAMALGRDDCPSWRAVLRRVPFDAQLASSPVLIAALASGNREIRGDAAWALASRYVTTPPPNASEILASLRSGEAKTTNSDHLPEMDYGAEILRRVLGEKPVEGDVWALAIPPRADSHLGRDLIALSRYLTPAERNAVANRIDEKIVKQSRQPTSPPSDDWSLFGMPKGLGSDLAAPAMASCGGAGSGGVAVARIFFKADGRPARVSFLQAPVEKACAQMLHGLFLLSLAPEHQATSEDKPVTFGLPLIPAALNCLDELPRDRSEFETSDRTRTFVQAKEISRKGFLEPTSSIWDADAGRGELQGMVSPAGCVTAIHVVQSSGVTSTDSAAIFNVLQWRYSPATVDGRPIRSFLRVTFGR